nr:hypothetical protein [Tanacetum cinerariifolium]
MRALTLNHDNPNMFLGVVTMTVESWMSDGRVVSAVVAATATVAVAMVATVEDGDATGGRDGEGGYDGGSGVVTGAWPELGGRKMAAVGGEASKNEKRWGLGLYQNE